MGKKREIPVRQLWRGFVPIEGYPADPKTFQELRLVLTGWPEGPTGEAPRVLVEKYEKDATGGDRWAAFPNVPVKVFERACAEAFEELHTVLTRQVGELNARTMRAERVTKGLLEAKGKRTRTKGKAKR